MRGSRTVAPPPGMQPGARCAPSPISASSAATIRSQASASSKPAAARGPVDRRDHRHVERLEREAGRGDPRQHVLEVLEVGERGREQLGVEPVAEDASPLPRITSVRTLWSAWTRATTSLMSSSACSERLLPRPGARTSRARRGRRRRSRASRGSPSWPSGHRVPFAGCRRGCAAGASGRRSRCHVIPAATIVAVSREPAAARTMHAIIDAARAERSTTTSGTTSPAAPRPRRRRAATASRSTRWRCARASCATSRASTRAPRCSATRCGSRSCSRRSARSRLITPDGRHRRRARRRALRHAADRSARSPSRASRRSRPRPPAPKIGQLYIRGDAAWADALIDRVARGRLRGDRADGRPRLLRPPRAPAARRLAAARAPRRRRPALGWQARAGLGVARADARPRRRCRSIVKGIQTAQDAELARRARLRGDLRLQPRRARARPRARRRSRRCARSSTRSPGAPRSSSTAASCAAPTCSRRSRSAPTPSASAASRRSRSRPAARPRSSRALELLEEEIRTRWGCSACARLDELDASFVRRAAGAAGGEPAAGGVPAGRATDWPPPRPLEPPARARRAPRRPARAPPRARARRARRRRRRGAPAPRRRATIGPAS